MSILVSEDFSVINESKFMEWKENLDVYITKNGDNTYHLCDDAELLNWPIDRSEGNYIFIDCVSDGSCVEKLLEQLEEYIAPQQVVRFYELADEDRECLRLGEPFKPLRTFEHSTL